MPKREKRVRKPFLQDFREFAIKGNVIDLTVGVILGAALTKIVNSIVEDLVMPPLGVVLGRVDYSNLFIVLPGQEEKIAKSCPESIDHPHHEEDRRIRALTC